VIQSSIHGDIDDPNVAPQHDSKFLENSNKASGFAHDSNNAGEIDIRERYLSDIEKSQSGLTPKDSSSIKLNTSSAPIFG
jgi:hypothetical protein